MRIVGEESTYDSRSPFNFSKQLGIIRLYLNGGNNMATVSTSVVFDANCINLKEINPSLVRRELNDLLVSDEMIIQCFQTIRDQVIFTNKRIFVINVQGLTGKKVSYLSYPYSKIVAYGIQTAGMIDIDCELVISMQNGMHLQFDFLSTVNIKTICSNIQKYIL